jgi:murein L,D-transpeptidase YcbB/YkuD
VSGAPIVVTLWHASGLGRALDATTRELLAAVQPDAVQLHASPTALRSAAPAVAREVRTLCPRAAIWLGVACDSPAFRLAEGAWSVERARDALLVAAQVAVGVGASHVVWNAEGAWKRPNAAAVDRAPLARAVVETCAARHPALAQGHTAYDQPHLHGRYPWAAWIGPGSPVALALPQVYCAPKEGLAPRGALARRLAAHRASWARSTTAGLVRPGLAVLPYLQLHSVPAGQTATVAGELGLCGWALPSRSDAEGHRALRALAALRPLGPGAVARWQAARGLEADGIVGPRTLASLGL